MRDKLHVRFDEGYPPKTAKSVLRVAEGRAGVPDNKGRPALLYTLFLARPCSSRWQGGLAR